MSEKELKPEQKVRAVLEKELNYYFDLMPEQYFDNSLKHIDYVAKCKNTGVMFGIECKDSERFKAPDIEEAIWQCMEYSLLTYQGNLIPIFLYPEYSHRVLQNIKIPIHHKIESHEHSTFNGMAANLHNFGEIRRRQYIDYQTNERKIKYYYEFRFCNFLIYRCRKGIDYGLHKQNYNQLLYKIKQWSISSPIFRISQHINRITAQSPPPLIASEPEQLSTLLTNLGQ